MKTNVQTTRRGFTLVELLVVIVIIASLAGLTAPMVIRQRKKADQTEAVSNAKQIGLAMFEFDTEYGSFPDSTTATKVPNDDGYTLGTANSNDYFRQLLAANISSSEVMFYAKTGQTTKPDGVITPVAQALAKGEVGFGYVLNGNVGMNTSGNPARVVAAAPMLTATTFDPDPYDKKAVILRIDNSATSLAINKSNEAVLGGSVKLLDAGATTIWGTVTPTISIPLPK